VGSVIVVRRYPLEMVLAEKIVTAIERGTAITGRDLRDRNDCIRPPLGQEKAVRNAGAADDQYFALIDNSIVLVGVGPAR
jgi:hypothetical protein